MLSATEITALERYLEQMDRSREGVKKILEKAGRKKPRKRRNEDVHNVIGKHIQRLK